MAGTDPNQVRLTGENSFIRLADTADGPQTTRTSHWRVLWSPAGGGQALFMHSGLGDDRVVIYSDNIALARWLQEEIESALFPPFADQNLPVIAAAFEHWGDGRAFWTESVESDDETIRLTWYDFAEPFMITVAPGSIQGRPHGVYSCFIPARRAQVTLNDNVAAGRVFPQERDGRQSSTACLAWSETWVRP
ncbi:hypothetical protein NKDENANG_00290 [Candidatus Entotheonellaceae bacterium PAL068K]